MRYDIEMHQVYVETRETDDTCELKYLGLLTV